MYFGAYFFQQKKNNTLLRLFVLRARSNLRTCIAQNNKRLTNPELFTSVSPVPRFPLHWGCKPIDLAEFLVYASEFGAFGNAPFTEVVRQHEWLYNIKLGTPRDLKRSVKDRKIRTTAFIDSLQEAARQ